ncbi:MAG: hypothetical protein CL881_03870 [Dehalococcoidia bacterium]|nr:hypothetical protein [Dehalococcoidia bacterium]
MPKKSDKHYDKYVEKKDRQKRLKKQRNTKEALRDPNLLYEDNTTPKRLDAESICGRSQHA